MSDAMETVFPLYTENAFVFWHHIPISLSYKYDLSYMMDDLLALLRRLLCDAGGTYDVQWLPDTFRCSWHISWEYDRLMILAKWENLAGNVQTLLQSYPVVEISKQDFISEWKSILVLVAYSLHESGYRGDSLQGLATLEEMVERLGQWGVLYGE